MSTGTSSWMRTRGLALCNVVTSIKRCRFLHAFWWLQDVKYSICFGGELPSSDIPTFPLRARELIKNSYYTKQSYLLRRWT